MFRKKLADKKKEDKDLIRWRGHEVLRIEAFSDAVFAFAVTLLIVSLEVPHNFNEMMEGMAGFFPFAICFLAVYQVWLAQNLYFRRFGLHDQWTLVLNGMLLFVVLFFVYPLKFLFTHLLGIHYSSDTTLNFFERISIFQDTGGLGSDWTALFYVYNSGYFTIYMLLGFMYRNALKRRDEIGLTDSEAFETRTYSLRYFAMAGVAVFSSILASIPHHLAPFFAGISYSLLGPVIAFTHHRRGKLHRRKFGHLEEAERQKVQPETAEAPNQ